jgi:hypothetical protein
MPHKQKFVVVLRGLVPRIHVFVSAPEGVDGRAKPGQDETGDLIPLLFALQNSRRIALRGIGAREPVEIAVEGVADA